MIDKLKIANAYLLVDTMMIVSKFWLDLILTQGQVVKLDTPIQTKDVILKVSENKEQLIQLIFNDLVANAMVIFPHILTLNGKDPVPLHIFNRHISRCQNL